MLSLGSHFLDYHWLHASDYYVLHPPVVIRLASNKWLFTVSEGRLGFLRNNGRLCRCAGRHPEAPGGSGDVRAIYLAGTLSRQSNSLDIETLKDRNKYELLEPTSSIARLVCFYIILKCYEATTSASV